MAYPSGATSTVAATSATIWTMPARVIDLLPRQRILLAMETVAGWVGKPTYRRRSGVGCPHYLFCERKGFEGGGPPPHPLGLVAPPDATARRIKVQMRGRPIRTQTGQSADGRLNAEHSEQLGMGETG